MRRPAPFLAAALLLSGLLCLGQQPRAYWKSVPQVNVGASYSGPGDVVSGASMFWGVRGYNAAFSGNILNLCDVATGLVCADATWTAAGGISLPLIGGVICNNTTNICEVAKAYDQIGASNCSGSCDAVQATASQRPTLIVPGASNGCQLDTAYCMAFVRGSSECLVTAAGYTQTQPLSLAVVATRTGSTTSVNGLLAFNSATQTSQFNNAVNTLLIGFGTAQSVTANDSAWHAIQAVASNSVGALSVDGSTTTANNGTNAPSNARVQLGARSTACGNSLDGKMTYGGVWPLDFTSSTSALNSDAHAYPSAW